jgi:MarR family transcriptional regulator, 2-MHQ and catechol-resistance regulon repressor
MTGRARATKAEPVGPTDVRLADPRITAVGMIIETVGGLNQKLAVQYAEHGLAAAEFEVLVRIARTPGQALRMSDLAAQTLLTTSGITRVVDRLERGGLVDRRPCPTDRRGSLAAITADGLERLDAVLPGHLELVDKWFTSQLTADELKSLLGSLRVVRDAVRPEATAGADDDDPPRSA